MQAAGGTRPVLPGGLQHNLAQNLLLPITTCSLPPSYSSSDDEENVDFGLEGSEEGDQPGFCKVEEPDICAADLTSEASTMPFPSS